MDDEQPGVAAPVRRARLPRPLRSLFLLVVCVIPVAAVGILGGVWWHGSQHPITSVAPPAPLLPGAPPLRSPSPAPPTSVPVVGFDVSYPQCGATLPASGGYAIVGLNGGRPLSSNRCAVAQLAWAKAKGAHAVYINTGYSGTGDPVAHGRTLVDDAVAREHALGIRGTAVWWLDVETVNTWDGTQQQNATVLDSMAARLQQLGVRVGFYSTPSMWAEVAGTWSPGLPVWYATGPGTQTTAAAACGNELAGSSPGLVQWVEPIKGVDFDHNLVCPAFSKRAGELFDLG